VSSYFCKSNLRLCLWILFHGTQTLQCFSITEEPRSTLSDGYIEKESVIKEQVWCKFQNHIALFTTTNLDSRIGNWGNRVCKILLLCYTNLLPSGGGMQKTLFIRLINASCRNWSKSLVWLRIRHYKQTTDVNKDVRCMLRIYATASGNSKETQIHWSNWRGTLGFMIYKTPKQTHP
jgi:hypothetical protein